MKIEEPKLDKRIPKFLIEEKVCKNYHARRSLLTYQIDFPRETVFYVCPVIDKTGTSKENWYLDEKKIGYVMNELEKVGKYFNQRGGEDWDLCEDHGVNLTSGAWKAQGITLEMYCQLKIITK
ncbi:hypothetical protein [Paenibacillus thalictri]|uniref:hypothetical protein n=1 Tax=Paenibacillus thalictri TaxID=2527873 RepID=UPI00197D4B5F|nr:hypothetical protein [Paenibacillus thalictri]